MKDRIPFWLLELAHKVAQNSIAKKILKPFYYTYKKRIATSRNKNFRKYALEALTIFDRCMLENNINYSLTFGSLLGAVREKGFIGHDLDIDVMLPIEERSPLIQEVLKMNGFKLSHRFSIEDGALGCEECYLYKNTGVSIDVFYISPAIDKFPYVCCWNLFPGCATSRESANKYGGVIPRRIETPTNNKIIRAQFENIKVNIPENYSEILEFYYGENYMTPDPNYVPPKEHRYIWTEKIAKYEQFLD